MQRKQTSIKMREHPKFFVTILLVLAVSIVMLLAVRETTVLFLGIGSFAAGIILGFWLMARTAARLHALAWRPIASSVGASDLIHPISFGHTGELCPTIMPGGPVCAISHAGAYSLTAALLKEAALDNRSDQTLVESWLAGDLRAIDVLAGRYITQVQSF